MPARPSRIIIAESGAPSGRRPVNAAAVRARIEALEHLLERSIPLPGLDRRIGLDGVLGLVPVVGDIAGAMIGSYLIWEARNLGMSKFQMARMLANLGIDTALGAVPLAGDLFDFFWKSNSRNLRIIRRHLDRHHPGTRTIEG